MPCSHIQTRAPYILSTCMNYSTFPWSHQVTCPIRLDTIAHLFCGQINRSTPQGPRGRPVRAPPVARAHDNLQYFIISYGTRTGSVRDMQEYRTASLRTRKGFETTQNCKKKKPHRCHICGRIGPVRPPFGLFTGCLRTLNPYGAHKLILQASKLYGPTRGGKILQHRTGAVWGRTSYVQNSPYGPRCVMYLGH